MVFICLVFRKELYFIQYIASKQFYKETAQIAIPVALQSLLSSCLGLIDTMMVSRIDMVSAIGTATQIDAMQTLLSLGATSGTAIFLAQYLGANDKEKLKKTFGLSILLSIAIGLLFFVITAFFAEQIIQFYTHDSYIQTNAVQYLDIIKYAFLPSSLAYAFNYAFRSGKNAKIPLYISTSKILCNVFLNYLLIFGNFGFPAMGVKGAGIATVLSQWIGLLAYIFISVKTNQIFIGTWKEMFLMKISFVTHVFKRIYAFILNEVFFGFGETLYIKAFASLGTVAMDAYFVGNKISSVAYILSMGISSAATIMLGNTLGEGNIQKAKQQGDYFLGCSVFLSIVSMGILMIFTEPLVQLFGMSNHDVIALTIQVVRVFSVKIALRLFIVVSFSALRAGGDSKFLTFLDSGIMWFVGIPLAFLAVDVFHISSIAFVLLFVQLEHVVRMLIGIKRLKSGKWAVNLTV